MLDKEIKDFTEKIDDLDNKNDPIESSSLKFTLDDCKGKKRRAKVNPSRFSFEDKNKSSEPDLCCNLIFHTLLTK